MIVSVLASVLSSQDVSFVGWAGMYALAHGENRSTGSSIVVAAIAKNSRPALATAAEAADRDPTALGMELSIVLGVGSTAGIVLAAVNEVGGSGCRRLGSLCC